MPDALTIEIKDIPDVGEILDRQRQPMLDAGVRALTNAVVKNFRRRNSQGNAKGFPRSNFWQDAAESVTSAVEGDAMSAAIRKQGGRLRGKGGEVRPKEGKKALAIPVDPSVAHEWPSEYTGRGGALFAVWPKGRNTGFLANRGTDRNHARILWMLVAKTTHRPDPSVIPPEDELRNAIARAMRRAWRAAQ
jgi:hypothetical protein